MRGQGAELPCGVWGNAPTVPRVTISPNAPNKGAGSEASLPVTLCIRRCAPSCFTHYLHIVAPNGRDRPASRDVVLLLLVFFVAGGIAPAGATRGLCGRPLDPFAVHTPRLDFFRGRTDLIRLRHLPQRGEGFGGTSAPWLSRRAAPRDPLPCLPLWGRCRRSDG